jgi:hypothetical protein
MNQHVDKVESEESKPPITTFEGLKKETQTAVIRYFAPAVAIFRELAATAGFPTVRHTAKFDNKRTERRE